MLNHHLSVLFQNLEVDAILVPSSDEHLNEYVLPHGRRREWASGFTGSAGDLLLSPKASWLFVDSRYHDQADLEVDTTYIHISKLGAAQAKTLEAVVTDMARETPGFRLGACPQSLSYDAAKRLKKQLAPYNGSLVPLSPNPIDTIWRTEADYPVFRAQPVIALPPSVTGQTTNDKLEALRQQLAEVGVSILPLVRLDHIAWLLNWRGQDVPYNPVFVAYAIITPDALHLFWDATDHPSLPDGIHIHPYSAYIDTLRLLGQHYQVGLDAAHLNWASVLAVQESQRRWITSPLPMLKACKNAAELEAMTQANWRASRAKIQALAWLDQQMTLGACVSEASFAGQLESFYAQEADYAGQSFNTIAGFGANGAIVHYSTPNPAVKVELDALFLIDSGAQYLGGTTDDTRTVLFGSATQRHQFCYTHVLKAHIACARQIFPAGTNGAQLDGITRSSLWQAGLDYGHGTGHGVGAFLNVHEGPQGIHKKADVALKPGMVTSIEPGFYESSWGGIRLENLYVVIASNKPGWLCFEALTWIPFDPGLVDFALLTAAERDWLAMYHQGILDRFVNELDKSGQMFLRKTCQAFLS